LKITQLFSRYSQFKMGEQPLRDVSGLCIDSRHVHPGEVFVAIRGERADGHSYLPEVCRKNISGVVVEDEALIPKDFKGAVLVVANARQALSQIAARYYGEPANELFCVGVTGTSGKTSTTYFVECVLNHFGMSTGVVGTIDHHLRDKTWSAELTTPDAITLQKRLREFRALDARALAMEVSSHAIEQDRADSVPFDAVIFTNLTRDHLDYHKDMQGYFAAKEKLFRELPSRYPDKRVSAIINANDEWAMKLQMAPNVNTLTYGEVSSDYQFQVIDMNYAMTRFRLKTARGEAQIEIPIAGRHNVYNAVSAIAVGMVAGASIETCAAGLKEFKGVPGRLQRVPSASDRYVFVDYAHKPGALEKVLGLLESIRSSKRRGHSKIITVFGCGGDRDAGKRPLMAKIAVEHSDLVIITSDNPRNEDPEAIIQDVLTGVPKDLLNSRVFVEVDRTKAITRGIELAATGDVVLIAGKGHEDYQIIGEKKLKFSDYEIAEKVLDGL
jgi:UDP-N-acetylmuramoyl-L-alanyl-D-glutamate--2,6-diaminopimelate ligase